MKCSKQVISFTSLDIPEPTSPSKACESKFSISSSLPLHTSSPSLISTKEKCISTSKAVYLHTYLDHCHDHCH